MTGPVTGGAQRRTIAPPGERRLLGFACLSLSILGLGALWPMLRAGVLVMPALWFGSLRLLLAASVMFVLLIVMRRLRLPTRQDLPVIVSVGVFMMGIYVILSQIALQYVPAGRATLLGYTVPLWVMPFALLFLRERVNRMKLWGWGLGVAGLAILFNPLGFDWSDGNVVLGNGLMILAAMSWAVCIIQTRTQIYRLEPFQLIAWQLLLAGVLVLVAALVLEPDEFIEPTANNLWLLVVSGPVITTVTLWSTTMALRHLPALTSSVGLLGVPLIAALLAWIFLGEALTVTLSIGLVVIFAGIAMVSIGETRGR
jgi:drug/metabolite transporter (DMT)-like permease